MRGLRSGVWGSLEGAAKGGRWSETITRVEWRCELKSVGTPPELSCIHTHITHTSHTCTHTGTT